MPSQPRWHPEFHRGSCICPSYELRITERCLVDDLQLRVDTCFEETTRHPIVTAFMAKRSQSAFSSKTVGPECGKRTLYHLGVGNDHRGATWHDAANGVVWLCAYGLHRSGKPDDAFRKFGRLLEDGRMHPAKTDHRRLVFDRGHRFVEMVPVHALALRGAALSHPGVIQTGVLGQRVNARVVLHVSSEIADLTVAFSIADLKNSQEITFIKGCFAPEEEETLSDFTNMLDGMPLFPDEIAFQIIMNGVTRKAVKAIDHHRI